jgi:ABC-type nitrate/sulfonate/bicarbonate transport system ATPase subunit
MSAVSRYQVSGVRGQESEDAPKLLAEDIGHTYRVQGGSVAALEGVTIDAKAGELVAIVGPSGCGKSTLLAILAGLLVPERGRVYAGGLDVTGRLGFTAYMPQKDLLLPWKSVLDNTAIALELRGISRQQARAEAQTWFPRFGLDGFERHYPATLSGGMRQRAALLRTFLTGRDVVLLDEPFGALDALTRADMQAWLLDIWAEVGKTIVLVTHDVDEAIYLGDRVYVMSPRPGRIVCDLRVDLPRPRDHDAVVTSAPFAALKSQVLRVLRSRES